MTDGAAYGIEMWIQGLREGRATCPMMSFSGSMAERETHDIKGTVTSGPAAVIFGTV